MPTNIRDRIKELRRVKASELKPSERNWREHPQAQQDALLGVLNEIGYADALLARELEDGTLELVDGHARRDLTPDQLVPVLILDVSEAEAAVLLATLDPLAAMAEANAEKLDALLHEVSINDPAVQEMLAGLAKDAGLYQETQPEGEAPEQRPVISYNLVFDTDEQQQVWFAFLRNLRDSFHDLETHAARIVAFIESQGRPDVEV